MKKIGDLFTQSSGKALKKSNQIGTLHKYITTSNLFWGRFDFSEVREMFFQDSELEKCTARNGDLLVCNGGDVGRAAVWNYDYDICLQNHITRLRKKSDNVNPCYYQHFFRYIKTNNLINGNGVGIESLSSKEILNMSVPYPSIEEQNRIVGIFDRIQSAIDNKKQQLSLLDEAVKSRFIEMFGDDPIENGKWKVEKLIDVCNLITDGTHKTPNYQTSGIRFISAKNIKKGKIDLTDTKFITEEEYKIIQKRCQIEKGDVLLTKSGSLGDTAIIDFTSPVGLFESLAVLKYKREKINGIFLQELLKMNCTQKQFNNGVKGIAIKHLHLNIIATVIIPVPPLSLQNTFAAFVQQIDKSKFFVQKSLGKTETLYKALMQEYFG